MDKFNSFDSLGDDPTPSLVQAHLNTNLSALWRFHSLGDSARKQFDIHQFDILQAGPSAFRVGRGPPIAAASIQVA